MKEVYDLMLRIKQLTEAWQLDFSMYDRAVSEDPDCKDTELTLQIVIYTELYPDPIITTINLEDIDKISVDAIMLEYSYMLGKGSTYFHVGTNTKH